MSELGPAANDPPGGHSWCSVLICDDQPELRMALSDALSAEPHLEVVAEARDGASCLEQLPVARPDVVILDVNMPGGGPELVSMVKLRVPTAYVLVFSARDDPRTRLAMLGAGADAYLVKTGRLQPLLRLVHAGCPARRPDTTSASRRPA